MPDLCPRHRIPRPHIDRITDPATALALVRLAMASPRRAETIAVLLDARRRGIAVFVVTGTTSADHLLEVVDVIGAAAPADGRSRGVVLASVRPGSDVEPDDVDRWLDASASLDRHGIELVEWFVIGRQVACPRDLLGAMPRW